MAKLVWDITGQRRMESGVDHVVLFPITGTTYEAGVAWSGVTAINESPSGADITDLYADNIKYASLQAAEKFGFGIEAYDAPEEWQECDGSKELATGVYIGQQPRKPFGLVYRTMIGDDAHPGMDAGYKLHIIFNSSATPSARGYATINENPDAISMSWDATSTPVNVTGHKATYTMVIDSTKVADEKMTLIEDKLFGSENTDATMLTPDELIDLID